MMRFEDKVKEKPKTCAQSAVRFRFFVAEAEGFEPSSRLLGYLISSQARYDHFDTLPYENPEDIRGF